MALSGFKPGVTSNTSMAATDTSVFSSWFKHDHDSGYDSLIYSSSLASSASTNNSFFVSSASNSDASNSSSVFSQPSTPLKQPLSPSMFTRNNSSTTPDLKHQYVADINAFYLASLRSPAKNDAPRFAPQTFRTSNFGDFSASNSASPVKLAESPKFVNPDDFIRERDNITTKLLRSPAFKLQQPSSARYSLFSPQRANADASKPFITSFSTRFLQGSALFSSGKTCSVKAAESVDMLSPEPSKLPADSAVRTTPTEEEFMEMLIKNRHMPNNPEFLIGRRMGIEKLDIISELNRRSMKNIIDQILSYTTKTDYVRMAGVSREWRDVIQQNKQINNERLRYLKLRKQVYEKSKENQCHCNPASQLRAQLANQWRTLDTLSSLGQLRSELSLEQKRRNFKPSRGDEMLSPLDRKLCSLDMNCLNNMESTHTRVLRSATTEYTTGARLNPAVKYREASLLNVAFQSEPMEVDEQSPVTIIPHHVKRSPLKAINLLDSTKAPSFIAKHLKVSPVKSSSEQRKIDVHTTASSSSSSILHVTKSPKKMDIIGSKKSKKNLKRL